MSANPPSDPDASPKSEPDEDGDDPGESDHEDTEPLQTLNPYGAGWGAGWGASWGSVARPDSVERSGRSEPVQQSERPVMGDVELPSGPRPFEFPTPAPGPARGDRSRMALIGVSALAVLAAVGGLIFWLMNRSPFEPRNRDRRHRAFRGPRNDPNGAAAARRRG